MEKGKYSRRFESIRNPEALEVFPITWAVGDTSRILDDEGRTVGYKMKEGTFSLRRNVPSEFPTEFLLHQVADLDLGDEDALMGFLGEWGFPFLADRYSLGVSADASGIHEYERRAKKAIRDTDALAREHVQHRVDLLDPEKKIIELDDFFGSEYFYSRISIDEARMSIEMLQRVVEDSINEALNGNRELPHYEILYLLAAARNGLGDEHLTGFVPGFRDDLTKCGFLTSAIANQALETIQDKERWYRCETCGRFFKFKQTKSGTKRSNSRYCSDTCQVNRRRS